MTIKICGCKICLALLIDAVTTPKKVVKAPAAAAAAVPTERPIGLVAACSR